MLCCTPLSTHFGQMYFQDTRTHFVPYVPLLSLSLCAIFTLEDFLPFVKVHILNKWDNLSTVYFSLLLRQVTFSKYNVKARNIIKKSRACKYLHCCCCIMRLQTFVSDLDLRLHTQLED